jgi:hypothetical protein
MLSSQSGEVPPVVICGIAAIEEQEEPKEDSRRWGGVNKESTCLLAPLYSSAES